MKNLVTGISLLLLLFISCKSTEKVNVLKLAHGLDQSHSVHKAMVFMAKRVNEKSNGKMRVDIYPSEQLGSEKECLELLQLGSLAMTKVSAAVMEGFDEKYKVLGLPYIFKDREHSFRVLDGEIGKQLLLSSEKFWLRGLCFYDAGSRSFYAKDKAINHPDDLLGMKIRVMKSITAMNMVNALGGSATPIDWGELYTALQSGTVDGAENNPPSFYLSRHYEVCKYYSLDEHTTVPDVVLISSIIWDKMNKNEQKWLQESIDESVVYQRKLWAESEKECLEAVKKAGVKINYPDKKPFEEKVKGLFEEYKTKNKKLYDLIEQIRDY